MDVKISVIIPVYNDEKYLSECLDSVIRQTLKDIEVICIDDGSTDHSVQVLARYCEKYPWITYITQENKGAGPARNNGMLHAKGKYICFLDADDYYISDDALEILYNTAIEEDVNICAGLLQKNLNGNLIKDPILRRYVNGQKRVRMLYTEFQFDFQYVCYMYNRDFLMKRQIFFPDLRRFQDPPFFVQAMFHAKEFVITQAELYCYRIEYREVAYTEQKICDLLTGLIFDLRFAQMHSLEKLVKQTVFRFNMDYFDVLYGALENHVKGLEEQFMEADKMLEGTDLFLEPLEFYLLKKGNRRENALFTEIERKIKKNGDIVIYGAGELGKKCMLYLTNTDYANMVMWVDHYKHGTVYYSRELYDLEDILTVSYDNVFIAVRDCAVSKEIRRDLLRQGIAGKKITEWCKEQEGRNDE